MYIIGQRIRGRFPPDSRFFLLHSKVFHSPFFLDLSFRQSEFPFDRKTFCRNLQSAFPRLLDVSPLPPLLYVIFAIGPYIRFGSTFFVLSALSMVCFLHRYIGRILLVIFEIPLISNNRCRAETTVASAHHVFHLAATGVTDQA